MSATTDLERLLHIVKLAEKSPEVTEVLEALLALDPITRDQLLATIERQWDAR